jgi:hypothetical protein
MVAQREIRPRLELVSLLGIMDITERLREQYSSSIHSISQEEPFRASEGVPQKDFAA